MLKNAVIFLTGALVTFTVFFIINYSSVDLKNFGFFETANATPPSSIIGNGVHIDPTQAQRWVDNFHALRHPPGSITFGCYFSKDLVNAMLAPGMSGIVCLPCVDENNKIRYLIEGASSNTSYPQPSPPYYSAYTANCYIVSGATQPICNLSPLPVH